MSRFFSRLSYSFGNEDPSSDHAALQIKPTDHVLCVTASGDRPLNLLTSPCEKLVSIDANPMQTALFDLKQTAMRELDHDAYLSFLGAKSSSTRLQDYEKLKPHLSASSRKVWDRHSKKVARGVLYSGAVERCLKIAAFFFKKFRGNKIDKLFSFESVKQQDAFIKEEFDTKAWRSLFDIALHPLLTRFVITKDPGLYKHLPKKMHVGKHIYGKINDGFSRYLASESILASLILKGEVAHKNFPPYLSKSGSETIRENLNALSFKTTDLLTFLREAPDNSFDCFSLSDVASYINAEQFQEMIRNLYRVAKPGARFCIRQFLSNHALPKEIAPHLKRDRELEKKLELEDTCIVYHFLVGEVIKPSA